MSDVDLSYAKAGVQTAGVVAKVAGVKEAGGPVGIVSGGLEIGQGQYFQGGVDVVSGVANTISTFVTSLGETVSSILGGVGSVLGLAYGGFQIATTVRKEKVAAKHADEEITGIMQQRQQILRAQTQTGILKFQAAKTSIDVSSNPNRDRDLSFISEAAKKIVARSEAAQPEAAKTGKMVLPFFNVNISLSQWKNMMIDPALAERSRAFSSFIKPGEEIPITPIPTPINPEPERTALVQNLKNVGMGDLADAYSKPGPLYKL